MLSGGLNEVIFLKSTWSAANSFNFDGFSNSSTWPIILSRGGHMAYRFKSGPDLRPKPYRYFSVKCLDQTKSRFLSVICLYGF